METKRVKRKKFNFFKFMLLMVILYFLGWGLYKIADIPMKNIFIIDNHLLSDQEIIDQAKLTNYPSFFMTTEQGIRKRLLKNPYIKKVDVKKKWFGQVYLYITENKALFYIKSDNLIMLESGNTVLSNIDINDIPTLINYVPDNINNKFITKMAKVDNVIRLKISEIEYKPIDVDKERFFLKMTDGNYVYLTLSKFDKINEYNNILKTLENKKGILYLDSGNYFDIFK